MFVGEMICSRTVILFVILSQSIGAQLIPDNIDIGEFRAIDSDHFLITIAPSLLPIENFGYGVFTKVDLNEGAVICEYRGHVFLTKDINRYPDKNAALDALQIQRSDGLYSIVGNNICAKINDCTNILTKTYTPLEIQELDERRTHQCFEKFDHNAQIHINHLSGKIFIEATRNISKGEEIYFDYGYDYWRQKIAITPNDYKSIIHNIPDIQSNPLPYIFEKNHYQHNENNLWLEFGVYSGKSINYISTFTNKLVYGFDSFLGLPETWREGFEAGKFTRNGELPQVNTNVKLIKGWFNETLPEFIQTHLLNNSIKISFIHIDCDLYTSTKLIFDLLKFYFEKDCIIVFDELINYPGFDDENGELRAFYEFIHENKVDYQWIGNNKYWISPEVGVILHSVQSVT